MIKILPKIHERWKQLKALIVCMCLCLCVYTMCTYRNIFMISGDCKWCTVESNKNVERHTLASSSSSCTRTHCLSPMIVYDDACIRTILVLLVVAWKKWCIHCAWWILLLFLLWPIIHSNPLAAQHNDMQTVWQPTTGVLVGEMLRVCAKAHTLHSFVCIIEVVCTI